MKPRAIAFAAAVVSVLSFAPIAVADPAAPEDKALAESLFREGRSLVEAGQLESACPKFAESHRLEPKLGTLLHLATCHEQIGRIASAWAEYQEAAALAARSKEPERQKLANERVAAIEPKLPKVRIVLDAPGSEVELTLDGRRLGAASTSVPLPVDPGTHVLEARAPGKKPWRGELAATLGALAELKVPALDPIDVAPPVSPAPPMPASVEESPPVIAPLTIVLAGLGVASVAVGGIFGVKFLGERADGLAQCAGSACSASGLDDLDRARTSSLISGIGFGIGAALLTGAVIVHASGVGREPRATVAASVSADGVRIGGTW